MMRKFTEPLGFAPVDTPDPMLTIDTDDPIMKRADDEELPPGLDARETLIIKATRIIKSALNGHADRILETMRAAESITAMQTALQSLWPGERDILTNQVLPLFDEALSAGIENGASQLAIGIEASANPAVLKLARERAAKWAAAGVTNTDAQITQAIADWIATGGTMPDLLDRVRAISDRYVDQRSDVGAITEVTRLYADGNRAAWQQSGVVSGYTVKTSRDQRVCPICSGFYNQSYPIASDVGMPPFHARCRCWIVPEVD